MPPESAAGLWGEDDIHRREEEEAGEGFDFADFADDELTPAETCARIEALAVAHALGLLGLDDGDQGANDDRVPPAARARSGREGGAFAADASERSTLAFRVPAGAIAEFVYTTPVDLSDVRIQDAPRAPHPPQRAPHRHPARALLPPRLRQNPLPPPPRSTAASPATASAS